MSLNTGMLAMNDVARDFFDPMFEAAFPPRLLASAVAGFLAAGFSLPFDFLKTRIQKQKPLPDGTLTYRSFSHAFSTITRTEGLGAFYRGFPTYYVRIAPHAMITLIINSYLLDLWRNHMDI